jgi:MoaA/NifB/PqqE/SkfB family radical SAM enzyme
MDSSRALPNSNFHQASAGSVFDGKQADERFKEYRRRWFENPRRFEVGEFPIHLDIESTSACNLRCPFCASTSRNWGPDRPGFMDEGLYRAIIDEGVANGLFSIKLSLRGEPLLHRGLAGMVRYAKEKGILDVYFNTNAVLLKGDTARALVDSGLDRISISFEGITKGVYERHRVGARFEETVENVRAFRRLRDERGGGRPKIRVQTVLLPELKETFPRYVKFWEPVADEVSYLDAREEGGRDFPCDAASTRGSEESCPWACSFLWQRMMILWDGTVLPCLMHAVKDFGEMTLGKAGKDPLCGLWLSEKFQRLRALHRCGRSGAIATCRQCSYREMELKKLSGRGVA